MVDEQIIDMLRGMILEFTQEFSKWNPHFDKYGWVRARHKMFNAKQGGYGWWHIQVPWRPNRIKLIGYDLLGELYSEFYDMRHPDSLNQLKIEILKLESVPKLTEKG